MFSSARNQMLFYRPISVSNNVFFKLLYNISKIALPRYSRVSHKKSAEVSHWLTASLTLPAVMWKTFSDQFECLCDAINTFQGKLPAFIAWRFWGCLSLAKLRPAGRIRSTNQFNPPRQIPCTSFSSTTFPTVDSIATALAAACIK